MSPSSARIPFREVVDVRELSNSGPGYGNLLAEARELAETSNREISHVHYVPPVFVSRKRVAYEIVVTYALPPKN